MRRILLLLATVCLVSVGASSFAEEPVRLNQSNFTMITLAVPASDAAISVDIKNANFTAFASEAGKAKLRSLHSAFVYAGGTKISLDVSDNPLAKLELIRHSVAFGDARVPKLSVSGTLEYRLIKKQSKNGKESVGAGTIVPVIVVKSLRIARLNPGQQLPSGLFQPIVPASLIE